MSAIKVVVNYHIKRDKGVAKPGDVIEVTAEEFKELNGDSKHGAVMRFEGVAVKAAEPVTPPPQDPAPPKPLKQK